MATLANLDVNLFARTSKFNAPLKKSGTVFAGFSKKIGGFSGAKIAVGLAAIGATVGALSGVANALGRIKEQFSKIDELAKFADSVDATVGEMKAFHLQAELTGTSSTTLEKGLQRFTKELGNARLGVGAGAKALARMNLDANELVKLPLAQQMGIVSDKINSQATAADRAALAYELFGRQGQELMTFFAGGSAGIQAATNDIARFNGGLSRVDAAQVEMANDAFTRLDTMISAVWQNIAVDAAPIITAFVEMFIDGASQAGGFSGVIETTFSILTEGIKFSLNAWNVFMAAAEAGAGIFIKTIGFIIQGLEKVESALIKIGGQKFDFGVAGIRAQVDAIGNTLLADAGLRAKAGFEGVAGDAFQARIDEIKKRAEDAAGKAKPPTVPEPPKLNFDIGKFAGGMLNDFNSFLAANPLQPEFESPTVSSGPAALTRGSSAAQTLINSDSQSGVQDEIKNELKRAAKERKRQLEKNTKAIENVGNLLQTSVGVLVGL